jgi:hypothetical protein
MTWHGNTGCLVAQDLALPTKGSHSHPGGDFAPYRALFSVSCAHPQLTHGDLIIVVLSAKYLRSPYCVTELYDIYERSLREKEDFLRRIIPIVLDDAEIGTWRDRVTYAKHWEAEYTAMKENSANLGEEDLKLYKAMRR